tara:strand:+ start:23333 stop:24616 length:1284 start_codon:yes stop_codon:yes gene_type:complete
MISSPLTRRQMIFGGCACSTAAMGWSSSLMAGIANPITDPPAPSLIPGYTAVDEDEQGLWMIMDKAEREIRGSEFTLRDPVLNDYVHGITCRLAGEFCPDIRTYIIRTPYFNASMAPNGMMQVWTGLLLRMRSEAQLAAVLGHEIGHYVMQHSLKQFRNMRNTAGLSMFLRIGLSVAAAAAGAGGSGAIAAGDMGALLAWAGHFSYGRDQEREADYLGVKFMVKAGYHPLAASSVWRQLIEERDYIMQLDFRDGSKRRKKRKRSGNDALFATHPSSEERMETLKHLAQQEASLVQQHKHHTVRFLENLRSYRAGLIEDQLKVGKEGETEYLLDQLIAEGNGLGELYFYKGELYRRSRDQHRRKSALNYYEKAMTHEDTPVEAFRSVGLIQMKRKNYPAARTAFESYLSRAPSADDEQMINFYLQQLQ